LWNSERLWVVSTLDRQPEQVHTTPYGDKKPARINHNKPDPSFKEESVT